MHTLATNATRGAMMSFCPSLTALLIRGKLSYDVQFFLDSTALTQTYKRLSGLQKWLGRCVKAEAFTQHTSSSIILSSRLASIVDGLDTMYIMGLENEYREAVDFISKIDFTHSTQPVKGFETGIRYLGGLLAAYDLEQPNSATLLQKATELTNSVLLPLFDNSPSKAPVTNMDLQK